MSRKTVDLSPNVGRRGLAGHLAGRQTLARDQALPGGAGRVETLLELRRRKMSTQGRGMSRLGHRAWGVLGLLIAGCAGGDTPARDRAIEDALCAAYPEDACNDQVGAAGSAMTMGGSGGGGMGLGGQGGGNAGGSPPVGGEGGGAPSGMYCDAPGIVLIPKCGNSVACHGAGSLSGDFGESEAKARTFVDRASLRDPACGRYINSADPEASTLLTMTNGEAGPNCYPVTMPLGSGDLPPEDLDCLADWLSQF
jgi:hypothetical protein